MSFVSLVLSGSAEVNRSDLDKFLPSSLILHSMQFVMLVSSSSFFWVSECQRCSQSPQISSCTSRISSHLAFSANSANFVFASSAVSITQYFTRIVKASFFWSDSCRKTFLSQPLPLVQYSITYLLFFSTYPSLSISSSTEQTRSMAFRLSITRSSFSFVGDGCWVLRIAILGSDLLRWSNLDRYFFCASIFSSSICVNDTWLIRNNLLSWITDSSIVLLMAFPSAFLTALHLRFISFTYFLRLCILFSQADYGYSVRNLFILFTASLVVRLLKASSLCILPDFYSAPVVLVGTLEGISAKVLSKRLSRSSLTSWRLLVYERADSSAFCLGWLVLGRLRMCCWKREGSTGLNLSIILSTAKLEKIEYSTTKCYYHKGPPQPSDIFASPTTVPHDYNSFGIYVAVRHHFCDVLPMPLHEALSVFKLFIDVKKRRARSNRDVSDVALLLNVNFNFALLQYFEEGQKKGEKFLPVDGLIPVDIEQVENILDVVGRWLLSPHQVDKCLDHLGKLAFGEAVVLVLVELVEDLLKQLRDVFLPELTVR